MQTHEYYEELCALLPIGELSADEYQELAEHLRGCSSCRHTTDDFSTILDKMPVGEADVDEKTLVVLQGNSYRTRFLKRAIAEGLPLTDAVMGSRSSIAKWTPRIRLMPSLVAVAATVIVMLSVQVPRLTRKEAQSNSQLAMQTPQKVVPIAAIQNNIEKINSLEAKLADLVNEANHQRASIAELKTKLSDSRAETQAEKRNLSVTTDQLASLQKEVSDTQRALDSSKADLLRARSDRDYANAVLVDQQIKINELAATVKDKESLAERERELSSVAKDVRELMGARNLHILDVSDVDGNGQSKKAIGRVFLVEGKSLVFYAFDLGDRGNPAKVSFQAWGQLEGHDSVAKNLGVFYIDDHLQKRWVLKVSDPKKLSAISSVFVTVEPLGGANRPTGKKLLYAYLGTQPNHP